MVLFLLSTDTNITKGHCKAFVSGNDTMRQEELYLVPLLEQAVKKTMLATWKESPACRSSTSINIYGPEIQKKSRRDFLSHFGCLWVFSETVVLWVTNLYHRVVECALSQFKTLFKYFDQQIDKHEHLSDRAFTPYFLGGTLNKENLIPPSLQNCIFHYKQVVVELQPT